MNAVFVAKRLPSEERNPLLKLIERGLSGLLFLFLLR